jgi:hypothetical protein
MGESNMAAIIAAKAVIPMSVVLSNHLGGRCLGTHSILGSIFIGILSAVESLSHGLQEGLGGFAHLVKGDLHAHDPLVLLALASLGLARATPRLPGQLAPHAPTIRHESS